MDEVDEEPEQGTEEEVIPYHIIPYHSISIYRQYTLIFICNTLSEQPSYTL